MRIQEKKVRRGNSFHMPLSARPPLLSRHSFYSEFVVLETCIKEKKEGGKRVVKQHPETSFFFLRFFLFPFFTFRSFSPGIQIGADSFITKPFSPIDVDARLRAFLRTTDKRGGYPVESPHWSREMSIHLSLQEVHKCLHVMKTAMSTFRKAISHMKTNKFCASSTDAREIWRDIKKDVTETNWILSTSRMEKDM
mmetsp:Transcript_8165/g.21661  ORF Transcript_8165/g.21661 Transcript_8165/m.21661 type:complete len:195 (+) Transcript_8165:1068-1652(+)